MATTTSTAEACQRAGRPSLELSAAALEQLARHPWPGNVRELRHAMDFLVAAVGDATVVEPAHLEPVLSRNEWRAERTTAAPPATGDFAPIDEEVRALEQARMRQALAASGGNKTQAAALIQMPLRTFLTKLKRYGLAPTSEHPGASGADEQA